MKNFGVALFLFTAGLAAAAQTNAVPAAREMSLPDCIQQALAHNLDVQIQRYNPQLSLFNLNSAYGGYDPTFNFSGQHQYNNSGAEFQNGQRVAGSQYNSDTYSSGFNGGTPWGMTYDLFGNVSSTAGRNPVTNNIFFPIQNSSGQVGLSLTQPLLKNFWIDSTRLTIRINKNRLQYSEQGVRGQIITSITDVENAYYELIYAQENVKVQQEALDLAQTQLDQDKQRVQIGSMSPLDVQQDESQVATSRANLISAENALSIAENALKNLLTDDYAQWHGTEIQPTATLTATMQLFDLQDSWNKGMTQRPDLLQSRLNVEAQGIQLKFYKNQLFPALDLIGSYGFNGAGRQFGDTFDQFNQADRPFYTYGAQLSMPLSNIGPRNQLKAGKVSLKQLLLQLKQLEQNVMVQIDNAVKQAQSSYQSVEATRQARIYAEAALDAEQKKYAVGKSTTFTVLQLQNNLTAARSQEIRSLADYNKALANLAAEEGSTLERNDIKLEMK
ncbi:MAG: TolC family protein [Verrucomicrobiales bacterium]|nr:TolC family protein [Verrucomicrobiales bacterium]